MSKLKIHVGDSLETIGERVKDAVRNFHHRLRGALQPANDRYHETCPRRSRLTMPKAADQEMVPVQAQR